MPLPKRRKGEKVSDFVGRCMGNATVKREFSNREQRLGVCYSQARRKDNMLLSFCSVIDNVATRTEVLDGVTYLVAPVVLLTEGVHDGSNGPFFYSAEELSRFPAAWNGRPVPVFHPEVDGSLVSCNDPKIIQQRSVGNIWNVEWDSTDNKLRGEVWINRNKAQEVAPEILDLLRSNGKLEVSTGLFSEDEVIGGEWNGEVYEGVVKNIRPDHLALLPGGRGACSWDDGCGVRANIEKGGDKKVVEKLLKYMGFSLNEMSYHDKIGQLQRAMDALDNSQYIHFLVDVYEDFFVYKAMPQGGGGSTETKFYKQEYSFNSDNELSLEDGVIEVIEKKEYIPKTNEEEANKMANKCCEELIQALIKNEATKFTEDNREWLLTLKEDQLKLLEVEKPKEDKNKTVTINLGGDSELDPEKISQSIQEAVNKGAKDIAVNVEKEEKPGGDPGGPPQTEEQYIEKAPAEMKDVLSSGLEMHRSKKTKIVEGLLANKRNKFTKEQLEAKGLIELETLAELAQVDVDYSAVNVNVNTSKEEALPIPQMAIGKKK